MMIKDLIKQLEQLLQEEITDQTAAQFEGIKAEFEQIKKNQLEITPAATENVEGMTDNGTDENTFNNLCNTIHSRLEKMTIAKATTENNHLIAKRELIAQLKELAEKPMDSLGEAFKRFNELKEQWRAVGNVPEKHYLALQRDYRFYNEQFFYTIKIFKDLQEHDLKKNAQLKSAIIERLNTLSEQTNIKELEAGVKNLQNEWDEIGPTLDTEWEKLRDTFKELLNTIYQKIQAHHHAIYESMTQNLILKNEIIEQLTVALQKEVKTAKQYEDLTKEVIAFQESYKKIGFAKKKENEDSWNKFRELCNGFFDQKRNFYEGLKSKYEAGRIAKESLIEKVASIKNSYDWGNTTQNIIALQKEWKEAPTAGYNNDNKLWEQFRSHCDDYFEAKKKHFESQLNAEQENLSKKIQLITRIQHFEAAKNLEENLTQIDAFKNEWDNIGFVPKNEKEKINKLYNDAIQSTMKKLNLTSTQLDELQLNALVSQMKSNPEVAKIVRVEKIKLKEELNKLENSISQKENNLLFFAKSKNVDSMLEDVKNKLEEEKKQAQIIKDKIKKLNA